MDRSYQSALQFLESMIRFKKLEKGCESRRGCDSSKAWVRLHVSCFKLSPRPRSAIHLAGTKGKGTTAFCCDKILRTQGLKTVLFTSPHLQTIRERILVNGSMLSQQDFAKEFFHLRDLFTELRSFQIPTAELSETDAFAFRLWHSKNDFPESSFNQPKSMFFCFMTLLFLSVAKNYASDVLIIEAGIGGRLDATNAIEGIAVSGITSIGYDHQEILGESLEEIAMEKAGIFRASTPAVLAHSIASKTELIEVFQKKAAAIRTKLFIAPAALNQLGNNEGKLSMMINPISLNAPLAATLCGIFLDIFRDTALFKQSVRIHTGEAYAVQLLCGEPCIEVLSDALRNLQTLQLDARWTIRTDQKTSAVFLIDGAHTVESMDYCGQWASWNMQRRQGTEKVTILFTCNKPRDPVALIDKLFTGLGNRVSTVHTIFVPCPAPKSLIAEISACGGTQQERHREEAMINSTWQDEQVQAIAHYVHSKRYQINVKSLNLTQKSIEGLCMKGMCVISCGSLYLAGELLGLLEADRFSKVTQK